MKKKRSISKLKKKLDRIFSEFVRRRDADDNGMCRCITCNAYIDWKYETDAGHFQERSKLSTRYDEKNVHAQCKGCNGFHAGRQYRYGKILDQKYGEGTADELESRPKDGFILSASDYEALIEKYQVLIREMK